MMIGWIKDKTGSFEGRAVFRRRPAQVMSAVLTLLLARSQKTEVTAARAAAH